jgi:hypothetical protein
MRVWSGQLRFRIAQALDHLVECVADLPVLAQAGVQPATRMCAGPTRVIALESFLIGTMK